MSIPTEWVEYPVPAQRNNRRNYYQGNRNQKFPRQNYNNRNFMGPGFINNFCDGPYYQPNFRPYRREFNPKMVNNFQNSFGAPRGQQNNSNRKREWVENNYVPGALKRSASVDRRCPTSPPSGSHRGFQKNEPSSDNLEDELSYSRCLTPAPSGSMRGCLKKVPSSDNVEEFPNARRCTPPAPSIPVRGCLKKAPSSGNLEELYTNAPRCSTFVPSESHRRFLTDSVLQSYCRAFIPDCAKTNKTEKIWTGADSMAVDEMDIETSKEAIYESDEEVIRPKITDKHTHLRKFIWGDTDEEETKDVGRRSLLKYNLDTLPNYDPNVTVGDEGVFELRIYRCTFCNILCLDKEKLRVHMISKYHYEKYKKYIEKHQELTKPG